VKKDVINFNYHQVTGESPFSDTAKYQICLERKILIFLVMLLVRDIERVAYPNEKFDVLNIK
jgi:hypothetical protein